MEGNSENSEMDPKTSGLSGNFRLLTFLPLGDHGDLHRVISVLDLLRSHMPPIKTAGNGGGGRVREGYGG
jgi:hypothetical protein